MTNRTIAIVQARLSSTRLPGKVLESLGSNLVLEEVLARCRAIEGVDAVCCATVEGSEGDPIEQLALRAGAEVVRGPRDDVLRRYALAAERTEADVVLRVTSDCPLLDPTVCAQVLDLRAMSGVDYATNNLREEWPHGLDCEAVTRQWLDRADAGALDPFDREHVTPWIRRHPEVKRAHLSGPGGSAVAERWTLDYPEDLEMLRAVFAELPGEAHRWDYRTVLAVLEAHPEIRDLNAMRNTRHAAEGAP